MHDQACGLVEHEQVGVFVQDRQRDVLWQRVGDRGRRRAQVHQLTFADFGLCGHDDAVDLDAAIFDPTLQGRARGIERSGRQHFVQAAAVFVSRDDDLQRLLQWHR